MAPWNGPKYGQKVASCGLELSSSITRTALTFDPESLDAGFQRGSLETDTAERQQKDSEKEDLAGVRLYETAESKQAPLQMPADPQGTLTSGRLALHETEREREREFISHASRQTDKFTSPPHATRSTTASTVGNSFTFGPSGGLHSSHSTMVRSKQGRF